ALPFFEVGSNQPAGALELSRRYGSFGLSKIYVPKAVVHQLAAPQLVDDIVARWAEAAPLAADVHQTIRREGWPLVLLRGAGGEAGGGPTGADGLFERLDRGENAASVVAQIGDAFYADFEPQGMVDDYGDDLANQAAEAFAEFRRRRVGGAEEA